MNYLADACALIVFLGRPEPDRIMPAASRVMREAEVRVSPVTVWEITRKVAIGKLTRPRGSRSLPDLLRAQGFLIQPLSW